jgi:hypothetical protein
MLRRIGDRVKYSLIRPRKIREMGMRSIVLFFSLLTGTCLGASISEEDVQLQNESFQQFWGKDFEWKFEALPVKGTVPKARVPYSGSIYLDTAGGTQKALQKYDAAFHGRRMLATNHEKWDTTAFQEPVSRRGGLFGLRRVSRMATPNWHGHCNGWTSAAIRHAEPEKSVTRNGIEFSPADIKALLAEIYIYNDNLVLSSSGNLIDAGLFHVVLANWIGRGSHPLGMESHPGEEKWNYPAYAFNSSSAKRSARQVEVKLNLASAKDSQREFDKSPRVRKITYFHYMLELDGDGRVVGGSFFGDSSRIDFLWVPLRPKLSGAEGNARGNPYVDVERVLAIWRDSVSAETRAHWPIIDPAPQDCVEIVSDGEFLIPLQSPGVAGHSSDQVELADSEAVEVTGNVAAEH